jgi:hypothetical protein
MGKWYKIIQQSSQITCLHASRCHHCHCCNFGFALFHSVARNTNTMLSCIPLNTANLLNIICTLVATCVMLRRLGCILSQGLEVVQETCPLENSPSKKVLPCLQPCYFIIHMLEVLHWRSLGCRVNPGQWTTYSLPFINVRLWSKFFLTSIVI